MTSDRPNVLFIALDDLNDWIGCAGTNPDVRTAHMDRLAEQGMHFANACCASPVCNPSRTAILTGLGPSTTGCYLLNDHLEDSPARGRTLPLPLYFRRHGYRTMAVGKIDHGNLVERAARATWNEELWDETGSWFGGQQFDLHSPHTQCPTDVGGLYNFAFHWGPLDDEQAETLSDTHVARWAAEQLSREQDQPFFLAAGFFRPHLPLIAPRRFFEMYDPDSLHMPPTGPEDFGAMPAMARQIALAGYQDMERGKHFQITQHGQWREIVRAYLACISYADDCVGQVLRALERGPHADNTIVVLWSDNGWSLGHHFHWQKWSLWDSGSRVPLIIKAPGVTTGRGPCDQAVGLIDLYPTLVDLCGLPEVDALEGQSLRGLLDGSQPQRERPALSSFGPNNHSLRTSRWRYTRYADGSEELYDGLNDPHEHENLAGEPEHRPVIDALARWLPAENAPALTSSPPAGEPLDLEPGDEVWFRGVQPGIADARIAVRARVKAEGSDGVIVHHGGWFAGYALYLKDGRLSMAVADVRRPLRWNDLELQRTVVRADQPLGTDWAEVEGLLDVDGTITLRVDGAVVATGRAAGPLSIHPAGLLEAGRYQKQKYPPMGDYAPSEAFPGQLRDLRVEFGPTAPPPSDATTGA